jgi:WD40 repeat protein
VDGRITLMNTATGAAAASVLAQPVSVTALAFSPDSKLMASGGAGGEAQLWDVDETGARVRLPLQGHTASVDTLAFSPEGGLMASGSADGRVILWDVNLGLAVAQLTGHSGTVMRLMFSADGSQLLTVDSGGTVRTWGIRPAGNG